MALKLVMIPIMRYLVHKTVGAQVDIARNALPAYALDFLDPAQFISTRDVWVAHSNGSIVDNL